FPPDCPRPGQPGCKVTSSYRLRPDLTPRRVENRAVSRPHTAAEPIKRPQARSTPLVAPMRKHGTAEQYLCFQASLALLFVSACFSCAFWHLRTIEVSSKWLISLKKCVLPSCC